MIEQLEINDIAKETVIILKYFDTNFISKIPDNFLNKLKEMAKQSTRIVNIDKNKKLKEQNISEETKDMIALIYYSYIATEEEKEEIIKIWNENETLYQKCIRNKYNPEGIFKKNKSDNKEIEENVQLIEYKEHNFFEKILNKIRNFLAKWRN